MLFPIIMAMLAVPFVMSEDETPAYIVYPFLAALSIWAFLR
jgi:hypothetical protein